jgi:hypothetical protein
MRNEVVGFGPPKEVEYDEHQHKFKEVEIMEQKVVEVKVKPVVKTARLNPDSIPVLAVAVGLVALLMISSFIVSFSGIYEVSQWTGIPEVIQWLPAVFIDAAILAYTISLVVFKARGQSVWRTMVGLVAFAGISVVANVSHTLSFWDGELTDFRAWIGVLITAAAPIAVLLAAEEITRLAFQPPQEKND